MSSIHLKVEVSAGTDIYRACHDAIALADRIGVDVHFDFNGVYCMAWPGGSVKALAESWRDQLGGKKTYKIATCRERESPQ